jgi:hypothetical protein
MQTRDTRTVMEDFNVESSSITVLLIWIVNRAVVILDVSYAVHNF